MDIVSVDVIADLVETVHMVFLPTEGLDDPDAVDILLNGFIEIVVGLEDLFEGRMDLLGDEKKPEEKHRHDDEEDPCKLRSKDEAHDDGKHHHEGGTDHRSYDVHERELDIGDIGRRPCDDGSRREMVDVLKGIVLDLPKHRLS